jgi:hypothetical protein
MDGQERMDREMNKEVVKVIVQDKLEPIEHAIVKEHVIAAEYAKLIQLITGPLNRVIVERYLEVNQFFSQNKKLQEIQGRYRSALASERGDVPGWVLVVLMTTGLVTAIWTIAAPRLTSILKNSLDAMNGIR